MQWYSADDQAAVNRITAAWPDAPAVNLELLAMLLDVAREQVTSYAPAPGADDDFVNAPPARFVLAQLQQVRNLWNAGRTDGDGSVGTEGYTFRPFPLDRTIKRVIRPEEGVPNVY